MVTGPSTLGAFLTSSANGLPYLAIGEHSAAIEEMLAAVRAEFETFGDMLQKTQNSLAAAQNHFRVRAETVHPHPDPAGGRGYI